MKTIINLLYNLLGNDAVFNTISLLVSVAVPVFIMKHTIRNEKKMAEEDAKVKEEQFNKEIELREEKNKVSQLPFLFLNTDIKLGKRDGRCLFPLEFINVGNGVALDITVVIKDEDEANKVYSGSCVCVNKKCNKEFLYRYTDYMFTNALPVNSKSSFEVTLALYENGEELSQEEPMIADTICLLVKYKDAYYNEYIQEYMINYSVGIGIGRVESGLPKQIYKDILIGEQKK